LAFVSVNWAFCVFCACVCCAHKSGGEQFASQIVIINSNLLGQSGRCLCRRRNCDKPFKTAACRSIVRCGCDMNITNCCARVPSRLPPAQWSPSAICISFSQLAPNKATLIVCSGSIKSHTRAYVFMQPLVQIQLSGHLTLSQQSLREGPSPD
jgi:hypothetical protein